MLSGRGKKEYAKEARPVEDETNVTNGIPLAVWTRYGSIEVPTPEQSKRAGFPWGRALRIGSITAVAFGAFSFVNLALLDGLDSEDLYISLFATLIVAPFSIPGAAVVLRLRRDASDFEVWFSTALVIFAALSVLGLIGYVAVHLYRPG